MKRLLAFALLTALVAMLIAPATALSQPKGGQGEGKGRSGSASTSSSEQHGKGGGRGDGNVDRGPSSSDATKHAGKAERQAAKRVGKQEGERVEHGRKRPEIKSGDETSGTAEASETPETGDATGSVEATVPPKLTGIANALAHIQANLARMQAKVDSGMRKQLPPGLVAVMNKFMSWLGLTPATPPSGGGETTGTVEPTGTVTPTGTVEPTGTPEASGTVQ